MPGGKGVRGAVGLRAARLVTAALCIGAGGAPGPTPIWPVPAGSTAGNRVQVHGRGTFPGFQVLRTRTGSPITWMVAGPLGAGEPARLIGSRADAALVAYAVDRAGLRPLFEVREGTSPDAAPAIPIVTRNGDRAVVAAALDGSLTVVWDGRDDAGRSVAAGVYFAVLSAGSLRASETMHLVR